MLTLFSDFSISLFESMPELYKQKVESKTSFKVLLKPTVRRAHKVTYAVR